MLSLEASPRVAETSGTVAELGAPTGLGGDGLHSGAATTTGGSGSAAAAAGTTAAGTTAAGTTAAGTTGGAGTAASGWHHDEVSNELFGLFEFLL